MTHTLTKVAEYEIEIDSVTAPDFTHYQYFQEAGKEYFSFLNKVTQEINFYNLETKTLAFKIPLYYEGPNSVGNLQGFNSGYHVHNLDSIFVLNRNYGKLFLVNGNSQVLNDYQIAYDKAIPSPVIAPNAPMYLKDHRVHLINIQTGMNHFGVNKNYRSDYATSLDIQNDENQTYLSYPESYSKGIWGITLHTISRTIDPHKQRFFVSYPIDDYIYEYNLDGHAVGKYEATSSLKEKSMSMKKRHFTPRGRKNYYLSQSKYTNILFDPHRQLIFRECIGSIPKEALNENRLVFPDRALVMLDKNLKKIGEIKEPGNQRLVLFFNEKGIHRYVETNNEDVLRFEVYEVTEI